MLSNCGLSAIPFVAVMAGFVIGCADSIDVASGGWDGEEAYTLVHGPADPSTVSVIYQNSLDPEALQPTDLGRRPLSIDKMSSATAAQLTGPDGALLRELLEYAVGCALDVGERFEFHWTDVSGTTHQRTYVGGMGLAPDWRQRALNPPEQELVSACLAARANVWHGSVDISMRGGVPELRPDPAEKVAFSRREGAFWGNLFSSTPYLRACYDSQNVGYVRSVHRACAAGHVENGTVVGCGMIAIVGSCEDTCAAPAADGYYSSCAAHRDDLPPAVRTHRAITVFLH